MTFEEEYLKMSIITTIQMMEEKIGVLVPYTFKTLFSMDYEQLTEIRDTRIIQYNEQIEGYKFAADMIYNRG